MEDVTAALEGGREFSALCDEVERRLGKKMSASDLKQLLAQYGARLAPAVTPDTDYLIVGLHASEDSPKRKQAERLCVPELTEREFRIMLSRADPTGP